MTARMTKQELCNAIYSTVAAASKPVSVLEICQAIGRKKAPHIYQMCSHLLTSGYFELCWDTTKFDRPVMKYYLAGKHGDQNPCEGV